MNTETANLLRRLHKIHGPPDPLPARYIRGPLAIPSLQHGFSWPASPQISARFSYADTWPDALCGITLLGLDDISCALDDGEIQDIIDCRLANWPDSPIHRYGLSRISLLGVNRLQSEEIYLAWTGMAEPEVISYIGNYEATYQSLSEFILSYCNLK